MILLGGFLLAREDSKCPGERHCSERNGGKQNESAIAQTDGKPNCEVRKLLFNDY